MFDGGSSFSSPLDSAFGIDSKGNLTSFANNGYDIVKIPDNVLAIGNDVFNGCSSAKSIILPKALNTIGVRSFYNCSSLRGIVIPDSVTSIPDRAFAQC